MATAKLRELAEMAAGPLACAAAKPTLEQRRRIELVLDRLGEPMSNPNKLRALRCVEALIAIGTPEAIELLRILATGADAAYETREASEALKRIKP